MNEERRDNFESGNGSGCCCQGERNGRERNAGQGGNCQTEAPAKRKEEQCCGRQGNEAKKERAGIAPETVPADMHTELQEIYRNAAVGMESVEILRPLSRDRGFRNLLLKQYGRYSAVAREMELYAAERGVELTDPSVFAKGMMYFTTLVNTVKDKSNGKLAEIMIQGINMGIISITKVINRLSDEGKSNDFAERMLLLMQNNLEEMKLFL